SRYLTTLRFSFFFFNHTATTEIYTLSLHDALPISVLLLAVAGAESAAKDDCQAMPAPTGLAAQIIDHFAPQDAVQVTWTQVPYEDRKSTRLNSSHVAISYAVFCLKKKKKKNNNTMF